MVRILSAPETADGRIAYLAMLSTGNPDPNLKRCQCERDGSTGP